MIFLKSPHTQISAPNNRHKMPSGSRIFTTFQLQVDEKLVVGEFIRDMTGIFY